MIKKLVCVLILSAIFMATPTWGMLEKSQVDNETIEKAIDRKIGEHNDDEESHLGSGQSLQSHKASEIIDHYARSVVRDKLSFDRFTIDTVFESVDAWNFGGNYVLEGLNALRLYTDASLNAESYGSLSSIDNQEDQANYSQSPNFQVRVYFSDISNVVSYIGPIDEIEVSGFGFKQVDNKLYAFYCDDDEVEHTEEICTLSDGDNLLLRCYYDAAISTHYFYVNGILEYSVVCERTVGMSTYVLFYIKTTDTTAKDIWFSNLHYDAEYPTY